MAQRTAYSRIDYEGGAVPTTITADPGAGGTSISIADSTGWPDGSAGHFFVVIGAGTATEEKVDVTSRSGTTLSVGARGQDGTSAAAHASGSEIVVCFTATEADEANYWVAELAAATNAAGDLPYADNDNSLTRLAIGTAGQVLKTNAGASAPEWGQVAAAGIASDAVETAKIKDLNVTTGKLAADAVTGAKLADDAVDSEHIADGAVDLVHLGSDFTTAGKALLDDANAAAQLTTLGVSAFVQTLLDDANAAAFFTTLGISAFAQTILDDANAAAVLATLGVKAAIPVIVPFSRSGTLVTGTGTMAWRAPVALTIVHTRLYVTTAPTGTTSTPITGQSLVCDVNKNGTTIYTTQNNRPRVAASANSETGTETPDVTSLSAGDRLTFDIDFVGSGVAGADLVANVYCIPA